MNGFNSVLIMTSVSLEFLFIILHTHVSYVPNRGSCYFGTAIDMVKISEMAVGALSLLMCS